MLHARAQKGLQDIKFLTTIQVGNVFEDIDTDLRTICASAWTFNSDGVLVVSRIILLTNAD
ncbi:hypothetical protein CH249_01260 [Rhodococcus sp. 05-2255-3B1]|nr:hypothetical protein CH250_06100 [Rhodococcus sp. 05-2255-3C]OZE15912.1 hypothetical protein CH249_01260 [Rhodococcus sp. 05-2255-3B1]OZE18951.1 hypothetical protein CH255_13285 [Rhodococcus sp. 05-2255-2A2]